ncbi:MAG: ATP-binding protein [Desulfotomaculaceae bacterium]|nr:ATP-binding protein [Desulfotomaculaceae bacterium]
MKKANVNIETRQKMFEILTTTHMLYGLIIIMVFILNSDPLSETYPAINIRIFALMGLAGCGVILLYLTKKLPQEEFKFSLLDLIYITFSLLITVIILFCFRESYFDTKLFLIIPVLITASIMGKIAGLAMSTVCSLVLVFYHIIIENKSLIQSLETGLIIISILYAVGWYISTLADIEGQQRKELSDSLLSLKEEIAYREQVEQQLRKLSCAIEQSPSIVMITDKERCIEYVSPEFIKITGYSYEEVIGKELSKFSGISQEEYDHLWNTISSGREYQGELLNRKKNGELYWEFVSISPFRNPEGVITHFLKVAKDITESKMVEKEMQRLEQLHLVGEMAASIGHEIRNPMTTVRGFLQLYMIKKEFEQYKDHFNLMIEELDRANSIITEYLSMARNKAVDLKEHNINTIVETLSPLIMANAIGSNKFFITELGIIPDLLLDEKEIRQIILNLVRNGLEAMSDGGIVTIRTYVENKEVVLSVQDQGKGIEPSILEKIGHPFFTTKVNGTGLGLSICYSIAARHNATIKVETSNKGTTFSVRFKLSNNCNQVHMSIGQNSNKALHRAREHVKIPSLTLRHKKKARKSLKQGVTSFLRINKK